LVQSGEEISMKLTVTKEDEKDVDRIFGGAKRAGRLPTDEEFLEVCLLKMIRQESDQRHLRARPIAGGRA
jgi:hypothetical protein